jgi:hypothetical protein
MRLRCASVGLVVSSLFVLGCGSDSATGPAATLTLDANQAGAVMNKIVQIAPLHAEIAWLADSANLVLKSGAEADLIPLSITTAAGPFYAVGLQRRVQLSASSFSTFDLIAFNDPSNPTDFIIIDGFNSGTGPPPTSTTGAFDGPVNGYIFHIDGSTVSAWRAGLGTGTLSGGAPGNACTGFQGSTGITCAQASLTATFSITGAFQDAGPSSNSIAQATLGTSTVAGIVLNYNLP